MAITSIGQQKTPARPIEITFAAETGTPDSTQRVLLIGHRADGAASGSSADYTVVTITNAGDLTAASGEAATKFGEGSELQKMVLAAIRANQGLSSVPPIQCVALPFAEAGFGPSDEALVAAKQVAQEFVVAPYDATDATLRGKLKDHCETISGAQRVENGQYGTIGVMFNRSVTDPSTLAKPDTQFLSLHYMRDTGAPTYSVAEAAAAAAGRMAQQGAPFNPLDDVVIGGVDAPAALSDYLTIGAGLESETVLDQGWTPWKVKPNGDVAFVRTVTTRLTANADGITAVNSYYDVQDFQVLYFWRRTLHTRFSQPDLKQTKASVGVAKDLKSEVIRLASLFEDQNMFQAVKELSKLFIVERNSTDRHRFDVKTPVNVIPGLHVIATNVEATTQFDELVL